MAVSRLGRGRPVTVEDGCPRCTETAECASLLVQPRPGTDAAIALAVANILAA